MWKAAKVSGEPERGERRRVEKHFPQYKVLLLFMWSVEIHSVQTHGVYSHGDSAGVNSIFSLLKKVASCRGSEWLRGSEVTLAYRC